MSAMIARKALLTVEDATIWMDHLQSIVLNRKRGAQKAAATQRAKKAKESSRSGVRSTATQPALDSGETTTYCGGCGKEYIDETAEVELWICCDLCDQWRCGICEKLSSPPTTDTYLCTKCQSH